MHVRRANLERTYRQIGNCSTKILDGFSGVIADQVA